MKTVLWISRHEMTDTQWQDLKRIMGGPVRLIPWKDTVQEVSELSGAVAKADVIAAVLPLTMMGDLLRLADGKPVIQAVSERVPAGTLRRLPDGRAEPQFEFVHRHWQQVLRLECRTRIL